MDSTPTVSDIETWLAAEFSSLGLQTNGGDTNFFEAGGSSLTAIKLIAKVDDEYGEYVLPPVDLFERPTIRQIAETIRGNFANERVSA